MVDVGAYVGYVNVPWSSSLICRFTTSLCGRMVSRKRTKPLDRRERLNSCLVTRVGRFAVERQGLRAVGLLLHVNQQRRVHAALAIGIDGDHGAVAADARVAAAGFDGGRRGEIAERPGFDCAGCGPDAAGELGRVESAAAGDGPIGVVSPLAFVVAGLRSKSVRQ